MPGGSAFNTPLPKLDAIGRNSRGLLFKAEVGVGLDVAQKIVVAFEVLGEAIIVTGELAIFRAVLPAHIRPVVINCALIFRRQEIAAGVDHDVPGFPVDVDRHLVVGDLP